MMDKNIKQLLERELERWSQHREDKISQINKLKGQLIDAEGHLMEYDDYIASLKQALLKQSLENDE